MALVPPLLGASPSFADEPLWTGSRAAEARADGAAQGDPRRRRAWARSRLVRRRPCSRRPIAAGDEKTADRRLRRLCQRRLDRPGARQPGRQGHRHPAAQGRARRPAEGRGRGAATSPPGSPRCRPRATTRRCRRCWRTGATSVATASLHAAAERRGAEAQHDRRRGCRSCASAWPSSASPCRRPLRGRRALRRAAGRRGEGLPGDQGPDGRRRDRRRTRRARSTPRSTTASSRSIANLERRRWLPEDLGSRYVFVNAGDYSMVFVDDGQKVPSRAW